MEKMRFFWLEHLKERDHLQDLDADGRIKLKWFLRGTGRDGADCIHPAQDTVQWWTSANTIMNFRVP